MDLASVEVGSTANFCRTITREDILEFARLSGDYNPLHVDAEFARRTSFQRPVAHGILLASFVSMMIGMRLPGAGALWIRQSFQWGTPVFAGDSVEFSLRVTHKSSGSNILTLEVHAVNQDGKEVMSGEGAVKLLDQRERQEEPALADRVALVTGGSRGIGSAIARLLAQSGAAVVILYRQDNGSAGDLVDSIREKGGRAIAVKGDVTEAGGIAETLAMVQGEFGRRVDLLVNNASIPFVPRPFLESTWRHWEDLINVQIRGAFLWSQAVLPGMLEQRSGCIVNIGSALSRDVPPPQWAPFVTVKSALLGLTRALAAEFGPQGIRVNMVSPGTTETESASVIPERLRKLQAMQTPLRRLATADDVARAVVFLCSPASGFITGADLPVSGGVSV